MPRTDPGWDPVRVRKHVKTKDRRDRDSIQNERALEATKPIWRYDPHVRHCRIWGEARSPSCWSIPERLEYRGL